MTAPAATPRVDPTGIKLDDGYSTVVTIALDPDIAFWEKTVTPPGIDIGDAIDTTTMHNDAWRTKAPRHLKDLTEMTITAAYDPNMFSLALAVCGVPTTITVTFPDGTTYAFYGYFKSFIPQEMSEGEQPEAEITIVPTNYDPVARVEAAPTLTNVSGT